MRTQVDGARNSVESTRQEGDVELAETEPSHSGGTQRETHRPDRVSTDSGTSTPLILKHEN